ncbi:hypothetical protein BCV69DRAFT_175139 [Microstroma glucosiphilum]|uniref:Uncharacterized protein n=1 Tax=Pseudomicrostroma glucosiphilum TaxID=1684307 RepID=A0A316UEQ8_9BASI|nr:hypothetical protein BCV69DRAFT_175139 [Pseudomicrostroma glucosiphilum]PWN21595.1 hypothetical protein BCV69DRAFT_175139 [Pseudomicrostroma glucosiphilum]
MRTPQVGSLFTCHHLASTSSSSSSPHLTHFVPCIDSLAELKHCPIDVVHLVQPSHSALGEPGTDATDAQLQSDGTSLCPNLIHSSETFVSPLPYTRPTCLHFPTTPPYQHYLLPRFTSPPYR